MCQIDGLTTNVIQNERDKLASVFPECFADGKLDFERLKILCGEYISSDSEKYEFRWPGKTESLLLAQKRSSGTLRPYVEESVDFEHTQNIYIEGDDLEVLKLIRRAYFNKIKMIYIDPPYNTGKDFIYKDDFKDSIKNYKEITQQTSKSNPETNGRFHSGWLNMMYPRLYIARDLLRDDGVIFISIDDNEVHNLRKICDEIFGEENFVCQICHKNRDGVSNDKIISSNHNFILFYSKDLNTSNQTIGQFGIERDHNDFKNYNKNDNGDKGFYTLNPVTGPGGARKGNPYYEVSGISNYWRFSKKRMSKMIKERQVIKVNNSLYQKTYKDDMIYKKKSITTWWDNVGTTARGTKQIKDLFGNGCFDFAKPIDLIKYILKFIPYEDDDIILDFFSGSSTTAHAVMQLNSEDSGNRKWIMVQLPELCDEKSEAYKAGYKNICEIGKERIRRAGKKIVGETGKTVDIGFKVFKLDNSNLKIWDDTPIDKENVQILFDYMDDMIEIIKPDRSNLDVVYEIILKLGILLPQKIEIIEIFGKTVHSVEQNSGKILICLDHEVSEDTVEEMTKLKPYKVILAEHSLKDDTTMVNTHYILRDNGIRLEIV